jgi:predicted ribosome quality control (RQC) complex YloA/Tae2 family protein
MKYIENEGIEYIIGENANDNWDVLKSSKQSWIWFHLDKLSSPYVILSLSLSKLKKSHNNWKDCIRYAALLCKENSKYTKQTVNVTWTTCKNVSFGSKPGEAIITGKTHIVMC